MPGAGDAPPVIVLHGWPQSWQSWEQVMQRAAATHHVVALDLPGVGGSTGDATDGSKDAIAQVVHGVIERLGLSGVTLVGHDAGGMATYSYLRRYAELTRAVIMDVVIPGLDPWEEVLRNPYIWHFTMHSIPDLPELLVQGKQRQYFDFFFNAISADPSAITNEARDRYAQAYASDTALRAGFDWYRAFGKDAELNRSGPPAGAQTPLLYLRGDVDDYVAGFRKAGMAHVESGVIPRAGHYSAENNPDGVWTRISQFLTSSG